MKPWKPCQKGKKKKKKCSQKNADRRFQVCGWGIKFDYKGVWDSFGGN